MQADPEPPPVIPGPSRSTPTSPRMTCPDILRRRPDGWLIDWRRRKIIVLEFTRPYDYRRSDLAVANVRKLLKYEPLRNLLERSLPADWQVSVVAFAVGVKGTADEPAWTAALEELDIPQARHAKIVAKAIDETLEACFSITEARMALLQGGSSTRTPPP